MSLNTANQLSLDLRQNLILNGLMKPDISAEVFDFSGGYNVVDWYITRKNKPRQISGDDGRFSKPIMGLGATVATVASTVLVGNDLRINFTDSTYDKFRVGFIVTDGSAGNYQGKVKAKGPGFVVLEAAPPVTAWNPSIHFLPGRTVAETFNASPNRGSDVGESVYSTPRLVHNHTSITRDWVTLYRRDFMQTWNKAAGTDYWATAQEKIMLQRFAYALEWKAIFGEFGQVNSFDGTTNYSMGFKAAVKDPERGGIYVPATSLPTTDQFLAWIGAIADRSNSTDTEIDIFCGRGALDVLQSYNTQQIVNTGVRNTVGGEKVKGLNSFQYAIAGIMVNFIHVPMFNDQTRFPDPTIVPGAKWSRMQYTMFAINRKDYHSIDGRVLPMAEKVYFGPREVEYGIVQGMTGSMGLGEMTASHINSNAQIHLAANGKDGVTFGIYSDCAYDFMARDSGWFELVV